MNYSTIIVTKEAGVAAVRINRPDVYNAVNRLMSAELAEKADARIIVCW